MSLPLWLKWLFCYIPQTKNKNLFLMKIVSITYPLDCLANEPEAHKHFSVLCKPDAALLTGGKPFFFPDFTSSIDAKLQLVVRIDKIGKSIAERFAHRYYNEAALGVHLCASDLLPKSLNSLPHENVASSFESSSVVGRFVAKEAVLSSPFTYLLQVNKHTVCAWEEPHACTLIDKAISLSSKFFTLKIGDLICLTAPFQGTPLHISEHIQAHIGEQNNLDFWVK